MKVTIVLLSAFLAASALADNHGAAPRLNFRGAGQADRQEALKALQDELAAHGERMERFEEELRELFAALPKNSLGNLGHQGVRYALHRFFLKRHGWFIRGLEPTQAESAIEEGEDPSASSKEWVPTFLQETLERKVGDRGSSLHDVAAVAAALEDLIRKEANDRLTMVYSAHDVEPSSALTRPEVSDVLLTYFMSFLVANNFTVGSRRELGAKKEMFARSYRNYTEAKEWFDSTLGRHFDGLEAAHEYTFAKASDVVADISESFYNFNEQECSSLRSALSNVESRKPGRVRLSTFYNMTRYSHWRFTESPEYLRSLGALDDTDPTNPSVIIANYAMARPNCLDGFHLFSVCCRNTCEDLMGDLERKLGASSAPPQRLLELVGSTSSQSSKAGRDLAPALISKLEEVAEHHQGEVPIHGRLFAQWMHHAFPLECPYPHEEALNPQTAAEWMSESGQSAEVSDKEMQKRVDSDVCAVNWQGKSACEQESVELPWVMKEMLVARSDDPTSTFSTAAPGAEVGSSPVSEEDEEASSSWSCILLALLATISLVASVVYSQTRSQALELGEVLGEKGHSEPREIRAAKVVAVVALLVLGYCADLINGPMLGGAAFFAALSAATMVRPSPRAAKKL